MAKKKIPISERALLARMNRKMASDEIQVKKSRIGSSVHQELGDYYSIDLKRNVVDSKHIDLEALARQLGVLAAFEELAK